MKNPGWLRWARLESSVLAGQVHKELAGQDHCLKRFKPAEVSGSQNGIAGNHRPRI